MLHELAISLFVVFTPFFGMLFAFTVVEILEISKNLKRIADSLEGKVRNEG